MMASRALFLLLGLLVRGAAADAESATDTPASAVIELTDDNFAKTLLRDGPHFIKCFAPWCGHCKAMAPAYEELAAAVNADPVAHGGNRVAQMDCTTNRRTCQGFDVTGFPRLLLVSLAKDEQGGVTASHITYKGARELAPMLTFLKATDDVVAAQAAQRAADKAAAEAEARVAAALATELEAAAAAQAVALAAGRGLGGARRVVTPANFDALLEAANATAGNALVLQCYKSTAPKGGGAFAAGAEAVVEQLAERMHAEGRAESFVVAELDCAAFGEQLCHKHRALALPRPPKIQWPQVFRFDGGNMMASNQFPGDLYSGPATALLAWALDVGVPEGAELPAAAEKPQQAEDAGADALSSEDLDEL